MTRITFIVMATLCVMSMGAAECPDTTVTPLYTADQQQHENLKRSQRIVFFNGDSASVAQDSVRALMDRFYIDQYRHFQDPEAPYFLLMSRDATLAMGIGGAVRMRGWYDFGGAVPYNGFIPYTIPTPPDPEKHRGLNATPAGTALFFRIIGINKALGNFSAYIQASFNGGNDGRDFKIKKSYVTINDVTIGYASSTFVDIASNPPVIDAQGPCGITNKTSVLLQWRHYFKKRWSMAVSAEFPSSNIHTDGTTARELKDWFPDVAAYGQYEWAGGAGHVRLSGLLRVMPYRDVTASKNINRVGYGLQASGVVPFDYSWTVYFSAVGGRGISSYLNDLSVTTVDLMPTPGRESHMYAPWSYGLTAGIKYNFMPNLFASVSASECRLMARKGVDPDEYKYGLYGVANVIWNMSPRLQVGAEYLMGMRKNFNGIDGSAKRVNLLFQFSF